MKYVIGMLLILGAISAQAKTDHYAFTNSSVVYGTLNKKSVLDESLATGIKCGYFLTKGVAYRSWGPSLTFFVEDASGTKEILYRMLNGTAQLDRIESLDMQTADARSIDKKKGTYSLSYKQNSGLLSNFIPREKNTLTIERRLSTNKNYSSGKDYNITKIGFKSDFLKKIHAGYTTTTNISCSFGKEVARF